MKKYIIIFTFLISCCFSFANTQYTFGDFKYTVANNEATITQYYVEDGIRNVIIPSKIEGYTVTAIAKTAFNGDSRLRTIEIPNTVTSIEYGSFSNTDSLMSIVVSPYHPVYSVIDGVLFDKKEKTLHTYLAGNSKTKYTVPEGILAIADEAFFSNENLINIFMPDTVTYIGDKAFSNCKSLVSVEIPKNVVTIGNETFYNCANLKELTGAIEVNENMQTITKRTYLEKIENKAFFGCSSLESLVFPSSLKSIGDEAFENCSNLQSVKIAGTANTVSEIYKRDVTARREAISSTPAILETIGSNAFSGCDDLETLNVPRTVVNIGYEAFASTNLVLHVEENSYVHTYAKENNMAYELIPDTSWLE